MPVKSRQQMKQRELELLDLLKVSNHAIERNINSYGMRTLALKTSQNILEELVRIADTLEDQKSEYFIWNDNM